MKLKHKIIIAISAIVFFAVNIVGFYLGGIYYNKVCKMYIDKAKTGYEYYKNSFNSKRYATLDTADISIKSNFGYKLTGTFIMNPKVTEDTVIIVHGITGSRWEAMKYADMYIDLGYNVLVYDSRDHGKSGGKDITLGFFEKYDLDNVVKWVRNLYPDSVIGVHGESIGAVTALLQAGLDQSEGNVSFYVSDCPYSDLSELFSIKLSNDQRTHFQPLASFILFYGNIIALEKSGFSMYAVSPIKVIKSIKTPIMFIHGINDSFIPPTMSVDLYMEKKGAKAVYIAPNADHAMSYFVDKQEYTEKVTKFLIDNKILKSDGTK